jgi:hypothetical protein
MDFKVYYGGHAINDKGLLKLKIKADYTQQTEVAALYATLAVSPYTLRCDGAEYRGFRVDGIKIDKNFDTTITLNGYYDGELFAPLYDTLKLSTEEDTVSATLERAIGDTDA